MQLPLIGVCACYRHVGDNPFHMAGDKYVRAIGEGAGGLPMILPSLGDWYDVAALTGRLDGLLLTGSPSNIEPRHYDGTPSAPGTEHDPVRDATVLPLIRGALAAGLPLLAICRGIEELNVALGGTLHQCVQELPGRLDHRACKEDPVDQRYEPAHTVALTEGGQLATLLGAQELTVNSLHAQAVDRPAGRIAIEAVAPDGTIEAVRVEDASAFALGIQWHPEWRCMESPASRAIFAAFGDACRERARAREDADPRRREA
jgi:putative glutamine amidotransferase